MSKCIRMALAELSVIAAKLCAHSPASNDLAVSDSDYAHAGKILLLQLSRSVDNVCRAVAYEAGLEDDIYPLYEALEGELLFHLQEKAEAKPEQKKSVLSEAQIKRLFAIATASQWGSIEVKQLLKDRYSISSSSELTRVQYDDLCAFLQRNKPDMGDIPH